MSDNDSRRNQTIASAQNSHKASLGSSLGYPVAAAPQRISSTAVVEATVKSSMLETLKASSLDVSREPNIPGSIKKFVAISMSILHSMVKSNAERTKEFRQTVNSPSSQSFVESEKSLYR